MRPTLAAIPVKASPATIGCVLRKHARPKHTDAPPQAPVLLVDVVAADAEEEGEDDDEVSCYWYTVPATKVLKATVPTALLKPS